MQPIVPLQYEVQINARVSLIDPEVALGQSNLRVNIDSVAVNGVDNDPSNITVAGVTIALSDAILNWIIDNKDVPA